LSLRHAEKDFYLIWHKWWELWSGWCNVFLIETKGFHKGEGKMNAVTETKQTAQKLIDAGFDVEITETETKFTFSAMSKSEWFDTCYIFTAGAYTTNGNRTRKYFSVCRSMPFAKSHRKNDISYYEMNREIDFAIRLQQLKVGA
jgi:hypothetical protein